MRRKIIFTIGHSTHTIKTFIDLLQSNDIEQLIDVRHYPGSRHCPHFGKARLKKSLEKKGIKYLHMEDLGGRRRPDKDSDLNDGWRSPQFRGYADYMQTNEFKVALKELMESAKKDKSAIMCAEAVPWRCHRSMIADALIMYGFKVFDIYSLTNVKEHSLTSFAHIYRKKITYPKK